MGLQLTELRERLPEGGLFDGGTWRWSPEPFKLSRDDARKITQLGHSLARFQQACDTLYRRSAANNGSVPAWIADRLDVGKPRWLIDLQRANATANQLPRVIRPDLLLTDDGLALTELDSVPGGIGVTAWLSQVYSEAGFEVLGGPNGMIDGFRSLMPDGGAVLVSEESAAYRPEMDWLTRQLGSAWHVHAAETYHPNGTAALYRFFELFDWQAIPGIRALGESARNGQTTITPPFKPHLEDKLWLALLWSPALQPLWQKTLRSNHLQRLRKVVPYGWVVDPAPLPPHAAIPRLEIHSWDEAARFSQKQRQLALKVSGFHETAWGARGVFIGHDMPAAEWAARLREALDQAHQQPWIIQEFHESRRVSHPVFRDDGSVTQMDGRVRLCPYFFTDSSGVPKFGGCLATIVPADKKKIHGMSDGILVPCVLE